MQTLNFGQFVFDQVIRHAGNEAIKFPIAYPSLLCEMILKHHSDILKDEECKSSHVAPGKIYFNNKLFQTHHAVDINRPTSIHISQSFSMSTDALIVPIMSSEVLSLTTWTLVSSSILMM